MIKWHNYCHLCQRIILNFKFGKCPVGLEGIKKHQILVNGDITFMDEKVYHFVSGWSREISLLSLSLGMWLWWTEEQAQSIGLKDTVSASMNRTKIRSSERSKWLVYDLLLLGYLKCVCYYRCCVIVNGQMIQLTMCSHSLLVIGEIGVRKLQSGRALWGRCPSPARHSLPHPLRPDTRLHSQGFSRKKQCFRHNKTRSTITGMQEQCLLSITLLRLRTVLQTKIWWCVRWLNLLCEASLAGHTKLCSRPTKYFILAKEDFCFRSCFSC